MIRLIIRILFTLTLSGWMCLTAAIELPEIFNDGMVLQRDMPVRIWGTATPGESITVEFAGVKKSTQSSFEGNWQVTLPPKKSSKKGRELKIQGQSEVRTFEDVLIGDVWLCSGQSNMEKPMGEKQGQRPTLGYEEAIREADYPLIRMYQVPHRGKINRPKWEKKWLECSPESLEESKFSAVGYYFAKNLHLEAGVPVGIIQATFGGTMIEAWMPEEAFNGDPLLEPLLHRKFFAWVEGVQATNLYHSMVEDMVPFTLRGFLWYQGEANAMYAESTLYTRKMSALIHSWRDKWQQPDAPFLYVQLAPFNYSEWDRFPRQMTDEALPLFWEAQTKALAIPHTAMVVTTDLAGSARDIHPIRKKQVGERLAMLARIYSGANEPVSRSPLLAGSRIAAGEIVIEFQYTENGLATRDNNPPTGFEIAGPDKKFFTAKADISGNTVTVSAPEVLEPVAIRFAWKETANPNLVGSNGLPVTPFRTDNWPIQNEKHDTP